MNDCGAVTRELKVIAYIRTDFNEKFGLPRQSGVVKELEGYIEFEPMYRSMDALRGLEEYNYLWLLWGFQVPETKEFKATVRPPRLGGNERMGVFATRSPFRPNRIGMSSVHLDRIIMSENGPVIKVSGIDMKDMTPIYDIKPYLKYTDSHEDAVDGFAGNTGFVRLTVDCPEEMIECIPENKRSGLIKMLEEDPRPAYQNDKGKKYGVKYAGFNILFRVDENILHICDVQKCVSEVGNNEQI